MMVPPIKTSPSLAWMSCVPLPVPVQFSGFERIDHAIREGLAVVFPIKNLLLAVSPKFPLGGLPPNAAAFPLPLYFIGALGAPPTNIERSFIVECVQMLFAPDVTVTDPVMVSIVPS